MSQIASANLLDVVPGLRDAVAKQRLVRDVAFIDGVRERIGPFEVLPMTLAHWIALRTMRSPLLVGAHTDDVNLARFLWVLNPGWSLDARARRRFMKRCRVFKIPPVPVFRTRRAKLRLLRAWRRKRAIVKEAIAYVRETFQDFPGAQKRSSKNELVFDYYSIAASMVDTMHRERGWDEKRTLNEPLKKLFQHLNVISHRNGGAPLFNPSDEVTQRYFAQLNAQAVAEPTSQALNFQI